MITRISLAFVAILVWICVRAYALEFAFDLLEELL
jgi:hypothetical protein